MIYKQVGMAESQYDFVHKMMGQIWPMGDSSQVPGLSPVVGFVLLDQSVHGSLRFWNKSSEHVEQHFSNWLFMAFLGNC